MPCMLTKTLAGWHNGNTHADVRNPVQVSHWTVSFEHNLYS